MSWFTAAAAATLNAQGRVCLSVNGIRILLIENNGQVFALENRCPHAGKPLDGGNIHKGTIRCPFHGAEFRLDNGAHLSPPAFTDLRTFPVRHRGDQIEIKI